VAGSALPLALATLVAFNLRSVILGVSPALPAIRSDLHLSFAVAGALTSLPFLCLGVFAVPGALLSNLLGPRRLIGIATATLAVGAFARILQPAVLALYAGTLIVGISAAIAQPPASAIVRGWFPNQIQRVSAIYTAGLNSGGAIATTATVYLLPIVGWRGSFIVWGVPALLACALWFLLAPRDELPSAAPSHLKALLRNPEVWRAGALFATQSAVYVTAVTWLPFLMHPKGQNASAFALFLLGAVVLGTALVLIGVKGLFATSPVFYLAAGIITLAGSLGLVLGLTSLAWVFVIMVGLGSSMGFTGSMALPPLLARTQSEVAGYSALMLTIGYLLAFFGPILGGFLLDMTGLLTAPFFVLVGGAVGLIAIGLTFRGAPAPAP
jgi:MFS transporter, CP family, cyanate transporter